MRDTSTASPPRGQRGRLLVAVSQAPGAPAPAHWDRAARALARAVEFALGVLGYMLVPLWPRVVAAVAGDLTYLRRYPGTLRHVVRHIQAMLRARSVSRFLLDKTGQQRTQREQVEGTCTHCGNCCLFRACLFLSYDARGESRCGIYGGRVWKMLACGDYPINREEIELYQCPSFVTVPGSAGARKVIPIAAVGFSPAGATSADTQPAVAAEQARRSTRAR